VHARDSPVVLTRVNSKTTNPTSEMMQERHSVKPRSHFHRYLTNPPWFIPSGHFLDLTHIIYIFLCVLFIPTTQIYSA
jgi:hypothetical protein